MQSPSNFASDRASQRADNISKLRALGKELFSKGDYQGALKAYESWLELEPESSMAHSNKSAAHMVLKQWESTYLSARKAQELDPSNIKAAYRRGVALMRMRCYAGAVSVLEAATAGDPSEQSIARALKEAKVLAKQATSGKYTPEVLYSGKAKNIIADYVGPVEVFQTAKMGRGLRVTRDVQPGELLFIENALASVDMELPNPYNPLSISDGFSGFMSNEELLEICLNSRLDRFRLEARVPHPLHSIEKLPSIKAFSPFPTEDELFAMLEGEAGRSLHPLRKEQFREYLLQNNRYSRADWSTAVFNNTDTTQSSKDSTISSIWVLVSIINHSCLPNVTEDTIVGDNCIVRASRHLTAGQELFRDYFDVHRPLQTRRESLKHYHFTCTCERCSFEESLPENIKQQIAHISMLVDSQRPGPLHVLLFQTRDKDPAAAAKECWNQLFPLIKKLERDLKAAGANDEQLNWCNVTLSHPYRVLNAPSVIAAPHLTLKLYNQGVIGEHATVPGSLVDVKGAVSFALEVLPDFARHVRNNLLPRSVLTIPASEGNKLMAQAIKTRYGTDLTAKQVEQVAKRVLAH